MTTYERVGFQPSAPPALNETNLNKMEQGIKDAHSGYVTKVKIKKYLRVPAFTAAQRAALGYGNLLTRTQDFDSVEWSKVDVDVTANTTTAPDGTSTADTLMENISGYPHIIYQPAYKDTIVLPYTGSIYVKANGRDHVYLSVSNGNESSFFYAHFDLSSGSVHQGPSSVGGWIAVSAAITPAGDEWYKISLSGYSSTENVVQLMLYLENAAWDHTYTGDPTKGVYLWGAQLEAGLSITDYVRNPSVKSNLLLINQANCGEDGTRDGFVKAIGTETITSTTDEAFKGATSIKVVTPGGTGSEGIAVSPKTDVKPSTAYTASGYLKGDGLVQFLVYRYQDNGTFIDGVSTLVTLTSEWQRVSYTVTTDSNCGKLYIIIVTSGTQAITFYVDCLQLQEASEVKIWIPANPRLFIKNSTTNTYQLWDGSVWKDITLNAMNLANVNVDTHKDWNGMKIIDVGTPTNNQDLANAAYARTKGAAGPIGLIKWWTGPLVNIPAGHVLMDGTNNTTDCRNLFIQGAISGLGQKGGSDLLTSAGHYHTIGNLQTRYPAVGGTVYLGANFTSTTQLSSTGLKPPYRYWALIKRVS
jgi:hypothetical protein